MVFGKKKNTWKYLVLLLALAVGTIVFLRFTLRYESFEGRIESLRTEEYRIYDHGVYLPSFTVAPYYVGRMIVRTKQDRILDLAVYPKIFSEKSIGEYIEGSYRPGSTLKIKGKNVILGFIELPGPKIELRGNPNGLIKKYRINSD